LKGGFLFRRFLGGGIVYKVMSRVLLVFVLFYFMLYASCASDIYVKRESDKLEEAVKNYWNARVKNDAKTCYRYENVSFDKKMGEENYVNFFYSSRVMVYSFEIMEIGKEGSGPKGSTPVKLRIKRSVNVDIGFRVKPDAETIDYWIKREDGNWYHLLPGLLPNEFR
jgi:hypothetical protein